MQSAEYESEAWTNFLRGINEDATYTTYTDAVKRFMKFLHVDDPALLLKGNTALLENQVMGYIAWQKQEGLSSSVIKTRKSAIKLFYEMNRVPLSWGFITKTIGKTKKRPDGAYSVEQIAKVLEIGDARGKVIVMLFASTGVREGAISDLTYGDLELIETYGIYKITVYRGFDEEYVTYCTPEGKHHIDAYLDYRRRFGEKIGPESPLIREQFDERDQDAVRRPKKLATRSILNILVRLLRNSGVRERVHLMEGQVPGRIRHKIKAAHGFRKFFDTQTTNAGMSLLWVDMLEGHRPKGVKGNYYRPSDKELLEGNERMVGYVGVIDAITIDPAHKFQKENMKLKEELAKAAPKDLVTDILIKDKAKDKLLEEMAARLKRLELERGIMGDPPSL